MGPGSYWQSFGSFASQRDILLAMVKDVIFGVIIAIVGCQRGLEAKGGPRGIADGVNATVVVSTVAIIGVNFVITLIYTVFFPMQVG
ncbi:ABC transporter permease [Gordonia sp. (in: high G+C Gram-positive bacteria)]|uniref:ABC transporter permease n=1 Tax=Gordonia sp. (in: high G+C Gram-positive bacteria) TaxID=84139 RepID=UPI0039E6814C